MQSIGIVNYAIKPKEEPHDMCYNEIDDVETKGEIFDGKNVQYLRGLPGNSVRTLEKREEIHELKPNQEIKIEFECKDMKPNFNLLVPDEVNEEIHELEPNQKIKIEFECKDEKSNVDSLVHDKANDWPHRFQDVKMSQNFATHSSIKIETESSIENEFLSNTRKTVDSSTDCKLNRQNEKLNPLTNEVISMEGNGHSKISSRQKTMKTHIDPVHNNRKFFNCDTCEKSFALKGSLKIHMDSVHNHIIPPCQVCGKTFSQKSNLKRHIDSVHNRINHPCQMCEQTFSQKSYLKIHMDSVHNRINHPCQVCGKTISQKFNLKRHIDSVHNRTNL